MAAAESSVQTSAETTPALTWRVHLLRREPHRLSTLLLVITIAALCVWLMFGQFLPALAAILLLLGATREYLFPLTYRITPEGASVAGVGERSFLAWKDARRLIHERNAVVVTPLATPSRLDAFRGVTLRFAPDGEPGDRARALEAIARCAPALLCPGAPAHPAANGEAGRKESAAEATA